MRMESTFQGRHRQLKDGKRIALAGGIRTQTEAIQGTNGRWLTEAGIILIGMAICKPVGYSLEIPGTILTPVEQWQQMNG